MECFRLVKPKYRPLDTAGSALLGGRWNSVGRHVLYCGSTAALVILESRVNSPIFDKHTRTLYTLRVPTAGVATLQQLAMTLPAGWDRSPAGIHSQQFGDVWLASGASLAVYVPSTLSKRDFNILVNPNHRDFRLVKVIAHEPYKFDPRLYSPPVSPATRRRKRK